MSGSKVYDEVQALLLNSEDDPRAVLADALAACACFAVCEGLEERWHREAAETLSEASYYHGKRSPR